MAMTIPREVESVAFRNGHNSNGEHGRGDINRDVRRNEHVRGDIPFARQSIFPRDPVDQLYPRGRIPLRAGVALFAVPRGLCAPSSFETKNTNEK